MSLRVLPSTFENSITELLTSMARIPGRARYAASPTRSPNGPPERPWRHFEARSASSWLSEKRHSSGNTLIEIVVSLAVLVVAFVGVAGLVVSTSHGVDQSRGHTLVLARAKSLVEEICGVPPEFLVTNYNAKTYGVTGVAGTNADGTVLTVAVDATNPRLLLVSLAGNWLSGTRTQTLSMSLRVFNPKG